MATDIDNAQAIKFCNEKLRVACDRIISGLRTLREFQAEYAAQGIAALVADTQEHLAGNLLDGSDRIRRNARRWRSRRHAHMG